MADPDVAGALGPLSANDGRSCAMAWLPLCVNIAGADCCTWTVKGRESCNPALTTTVAEPGDVPYGIKKLICVALTYYIGAGWPLTVTATSASTGTYGTSWAVSVRPARVSP